MTKSNNSPNNIQSETKNDSKSQAQIETQIMITFAKLQKGFHSKTLRSLENRQAALQNLKKLVTENEQLITQALFKDLRKPEQESFLGEIAVTLEEIKLVQQNLKSWMQPQKIKTPITLLPGQSYIYSEPLGVVLIIAPWNYPFLLAMSPLIGALAAGNCALIKPSEMAPATSKLIADLIPQYFSDDQVQVIEGGVEHTTELLKQKFDHIFFTGSSNVGRIVMQAAALNLTPVTLELGGKSPALVTAQADLDLAARRLVWGKFYNAGQTCVAPDYIYVHSSVAQKFIEKVKQNISEQFGKSIKSSQSYGRIINPRNFHRLTKLINSSKIVFGGEVDLDDLYIEPTVLANVNWDEALMQEEIFGPLLPIMEYDSIDEVYAKINSQPKPLSAYLFSESKKEVGEFIESISFGGGCINDVLLHLGNPHLPFGGVGASGMGSYHGQKSFDIFSHKKSILQRSGLFDVKARYAPYSQATLNLLKKFI